MKVEQESEKTLRQREASKRYRERNKEKERERTRKAAEVKRSSNREAYNAYMREWTTANKDRVNAARRGKRANDVEYAHRANEVLALRTIATALVRIVNHLENQEST